MKVIICLIFLIPTVAFSQQSDNVTIYPNPAQDIVSVKIEQRSEPVMVKILNTEGKVLWSEYKEESQFKLDLHLYPNGTYYVQVGWNDQVEIHTLVKTEL